MRQALSCPASRRRHTLHGFTPRRAPRGFTLVSAIFIVVVLAALGAGMASVSQRLHEASAQDLESARALQAARAGLEWAAFQVLRNPPPPAAAPACPNLTSFAPAGITHFTVSVSCKHTITTDGANTLNFYLLTANACNAPLGGACPGSSTVQPGYVERQLRWTVAR